MLVLPVPGGPHRIIDASRAGGDHPPDRAVGPGQMLLADDLVERSRPQPVGERRVGGRRFRRARGQLLIGEQIGHAICISAPRKMHPASCPRCS